MANKTFLLIKEHLMWEIRAMESAFWLLTGITGGMLILSGVFHDWAMLLNAIPAMFAMVVLVSLRNQTVDKYNYYVRRMNAKGDD
jgi:hypothetical protein